MSIAWYFTQIGKGTLRINGSGEFTPMKNKVPLYIFTTAKKRDDLDWNIELARFGITDETHDFTVDSWNNLAKYHDIRKACIIFDEQRLVGNGAWVKAFYKMASNNVWIMLSATPGDQWMDYIPVFVANGYYRNRTDFIRRHVVYAGWSKYPRVDRYVDVEALERIRSMIVIEMPYERHTKRHVRFVNVDYDKEMYDRVWKERWHIFEDRPIKDVGELFVVIRKVVNSHESRVDSIVELLEKHPRLIVFYNFNFELEMLRDIGVSKIPGLKIAEWNGHKHEPVPDDERWLYLVQYMAGAEAWECIDTDAMAFFSLNYSYRINEQSRGRIDRMTTPFVDLYYYLLRSNTAIDKAIYAAISRKKTFSEGSFAKKMGVEFEETA